MYRHRPGLGWKSLASAVNDCELISRRHKKGLVVIFHPCPDAVRGTRRTALVDPVWRAKDGCLIAVKFT